MTNLNRTKLVAPLAAAALAVVLTGCRRDKSSVAEFFPDDHAYRPTAQAYKAQAASGARNDATLQSHHFDGENLNSLGEAKLDLMVRDDDTAAPMLVFLNLEKDDDRTKGRRDAIVEYLKDRGMMGDQIEFKSGANPANAHMTAHSLARINKTETSSESSSASTDTAPAAGAGK